MIAAMPAGADGVLVLFADRLALYRTGSRRWRILNTSRELGKFSGIDSGIPRRFLDHRATWRRAVETGRRSSKSPHGRSATRAASELVDADDPLPSSSGDELFFAGRLKGDSMRAVGALVRYDAADSEWKLCVPRPPIIFADGGGRTASFGASRAHRSGGSVDGRWIQVEKFGMLAGSIFEVATERDGGFWLGTSEGIAHYPPHVWTTPDLVEQLDQPVNAITEDGKGRLWFAGNRLPAGARRVDLERLPMAARDADPGGAKRHTLGNG